MTKNFKPTAIQKETLRVLRDTCSDKDGKLPEELKGEFVHVHLDDDGVPYVQGLNGLITFHKTDENYICYSPNYGSDHGHVCIELINLSMLAQAHQTQVLIGPPHFVNPTTGELVTGQHARHAWGDFMRKHIIADMKMAIEARQEEEAKPQIIVPDQKIVTRS